MLAAGYSMPVLKLELGALVSAADVKGYESELDLRGMLVVKPPLFPVYGRATLGMSNLLHGPKAFTYGASLGARLGVMGLGAFAEVGAIAKRLEIDGEKKDAWIAEGRLGVYWD